MPHGVPIKTLLPLARNSIFPRNHGCGDLGEESHGAKAQSHPGLRVSLTQSPRVLIKLIHAMATGLQSRLQQASSSDSEMNWAIATCLLKPALNQLKRRWCCTGLPHTAHFPFYVSGTMLNSMSLRLELSFNVEDVPSANMLHVFC